jgi:SpoVK/Ycf46/Vps4 family AAA+-type ATPase
MIFYLYISIVYQEMYQVVQYPEKYKKSLNKILFSSTPSNKLKIPKYIRVKGHIYKTKLIDTDIKEFDMAVSTRQRMFLNLGIGEKYIISEIPENEVKVGEEVTVNVKLLPPTAKMRIQEESLSDMIRKTVKLYDSKKINVCSENGMIYEYETICDPGYYMFDPKKTTIINIQPKTTNITISKSLLEKIISSSSEKKSSIDYNRLLDEKVWLELGIGGLSEEIRSIMRRAFLSRFLSVEHQIKYQVKHVKGVLLYGPPGTGKTLIASKFAQVLGINTIKIVKGPEIISSYLGQSEQNLRNLFKEAIEEYREKQEHSNLHVIIFDEIDALFRTRGTGGSVSGDVNDKMVNQLLSYMDGCEKLNNILIFGLTNRKDIIDTAVLRPGRFEIQIRIDLPSYEGRLQIIKIFIDKQRDLINENVDANYLGQVTENYTGAEIEGIFNSASSFAYMRHFTNKNDINSPIMLDVEDFKGAIKEVKNKLLFSASIPRNIKCTDDLSTLCDDHNIVLVYGPNNSGRTNKAFGIANTRGHQHVKYVSPRDMMRFSDNIKSSYIDSIFDSCYKTACSTVILDDLDRMISFSPVGNIYNNNLLQAILIMIKKDIDKKSEYGNQILDIILVFHSNAYDFLQQVGLVEVANLTINTYS